jgi:hypothetical protein
MSFLGSLQAVPEVSTVTFLTHYQKLGANLTTPTCITTAGVGLDGLPLQMMFPRLFHNDAYRDVLPNLPASSYSVLYSSDHAFTPLTGYLGRADFDDIEGTWTDFGAAVHSHADQRETPHPVYDPINNRVNVYVHDTSSTITHGAQAARLLTTTDLVTFTDQGECMPYGHQTGYIQVWYDEADEVFKSAHIMIGGEYVASGYSTSVDGETFSLQQMIAMSQNQCVGTNKLFGAEPFIFTWGGRTYQLSNLQTRPRAHTTRVEALVAFEIDTTTYRPIGDAFYTLLRPGAIGDTDYRLDNHNSIVQIGNILYLLYDARSAAGAGAIHLAKATLTPAKTAATRTPYVYPVLPTGELSRGSTVTEEFDWNAVADDLQMGITKAVTAGSDTSAHQAGIGYRLSGTSTPNLWLYGDAAYDPTVSETLEFAVHNLHYTHSGVSAFRLGFNAGTSSISGDAAYLEWATTTDSAGNVVMVKAGTTQSWRAWTIPYSAGALPQSWSRTHPFTLAVRVSNYGTRISLLVDGHVSVSRDLSVHGMVWMDDVRPFLQYQAGAEMFFTRLTMTRFT